MKQKSFSIFSVGLPTTNCVMVISILGIVLATKNTCFSFVESVPRSSRPLSSKPLASSFLVLLEQSRPTTTIKRSSESKSAQTITITTLYSVLPKERSLLSQSVYETIQNGRIAVVPEFLSRSEVAELQRDAQSIHSQGYFTTDALSSYGTNGKFDPTKDRTVLKLQQWKDPTIGSYQLRTGSFANRIRDLRTDLAYQLNRPKLMVGDAVTQFGKGSTEISYTRFGPGAYLKRHVDEHHEELKGTAGWSQPTRRSLSWLIYLNDPSWDPNLDGGYLRCYERAIRRPPSHPVGARANGDLQIGWLRADPLNNDPIERPVFLDSQHVNKAGDIYANCALYIDSNDNERTTEGKVYISKSFNAHPALFVTGSELLVQKLYIPQRNVASRFHLIEPPKSRIQDLFDQFSATTTIDDEEKLQDVSPIGGTLVVFDSVSLPHEVLPSIRRERWAASGWMHEDQQQIDNHPHYYNSNAVSLQ